MPRVECLVDIDSTACPCCAGTLHRIGEDVSERLDVVPAQFRVLVIRRPRYACRACGDAIVQAPAPARLIEGGLPTDALIAQVLVSKYADHLPLYRQAQIFARQGVSLDRSTLADWVGRAAFLLRPVHGRLPETLKRSGKLFADEITAPVLDPGRGRIKTGQLWAYARDDRPWGGTDPPSVAYVYAPDRTAARRIAHLCGFAGVLQVDGYAAYESLAKRGAARPAYCWSHVRRQFYDLAASSPIAKETLSRIAVLYRIEAEIRPDHPLRTIRQLTDVALAALSGDFSALYAARIGRPSIPPEMLLRAMLLQAFYSIRSERQLMERLEFDLLFRWFVGLSVDDPALDHSSFSKNGDRLLAGEIAAKFLAAVLAQPRVKRLLSSDHFSVDGTLIEAWASMKSLKPKDQSGDQAPPPAGGRNAEVDFRGQKRSNETHASTTDPEARLYRKGPGMEAKLCFIGHALMENRSALIVDTCLTSADGHAERIAALAMIEPGADRPKAISVGADKAYDAEDFIDEPRSMNVRARGPEHQRPPLVHR